MSKYRKKPIVIEAIVFTPGLWTYDRSLCEEYQIRYDSADLFFVNTLEGNMLVSDGDYVIRGIAGEHYPCRPDIFRATYEPVEEK